MFERTPPALYMRRGKWGLTSHRLPTNKAAPAESAPGVFQPADIRKDTIKYRRTCVLALADGTIFRGQSLERRATPQAKSFSIPH